MPAFPRVHALGLGTHVIDAGGAAANPVAATPTNEAGPGKVVRIASGGHDDNTTLVTILSGQMP